MHDQDDKPRLTVAAASASSKSGGWEAVVDGSIPGAVGGVVAGGFGVEAVKSIMTGDLVGRWWFVVGLLAGLALLGLAACLRKRARRQVRVGVVVTARDPRRGNARVRLLEQQAESFSTRTCMITLKTSVDLPSSRPWDVEMVAALADETLTAITMATRLTPDAVRVNLIPTMPLHVAFWFGSRLGYTHAREVAVHSIRQGDGAPTYFSATSLRAVESVEKPLFVDPVQRFDEGDPAVVALALDLQGRGDQFFEHVLVACREYGVGLLVGLRTGSTTLPETQDAFTSVVEQVVKAWKDAPITPAARTGKHLIFLSGPVAIAVALGARLAAPNPGSWNALTFDPTTNTYEAFPALSAH
jgi:hypothetical protein